MIYNLLSDFYINNYGEIISISF